MGQVRPRAVGWPLLGTASSAPRVSDSVLLIEIAPEAVERSLAEREREPVNRIVTSVAVAMLAASPAAGQQRPVVWTAVPPGRAVPAGGVATVRLTATIDPGWHLYSITQGPGGPIPTRIALAPGQQFVLADSVRGPAPTRRPDPNFGIDVETYERAVTFALRLRASSEAAPGTDTVVIKARYQACNATLCLPPRTEAISVTLTVEHAARANAKGTKMSAASTTAG